jgi:REP element-mobilizing transposase RayT
VTLRLRPGTPSVRTVRFVRAFERSLARVRARSDFRVVHYSLQGNHAHFIVEARDQAALGRGMTSLATRLAMTVNRVHARRGRVLADRYHLRRLRTPREVRNALAYVLQNARKHLAEHIARVPRAMRPDPASSGRWFDGWAWEGWGRALDPAMPVTAPRSWLLRVGWLRHGRIDPDEVPGRRSETPS